MSDPVRFGLLLLIGYLVVQRGYELQLSRRNRALLAPLGAVEHGRAHFLWIVALHAAYPLALIAEVALLGARPGPWTASLVAVFVAAQWLRFHAIRELGPYWNTRILVVPGMTRVRTGVYRWLRHPNYVAVVLELAAIPLIFGAWRTAIAASLVNLVLLSFRIRAEERALATAAGGSA